MEHCSATLKPEENKIKLKYQTILEPIFRGGGKKNIGMGAKNRRETEARTDTAYMCMPKKAVT